MNFLVKNAIKSPPTLFTSHLSRLVRRLERRLLHRSITHCESTYSLDGNRVFDNIPASRDQGSDALLSLELLMLSHRFYDDLPVKGRCGFTDDSVDSVYFLESPRSFPVEESENSGYW